VGVDAVDECTLRVAVLLGICSAHFYYSVGIE